MSKNKIKIFSKPIDKSIKVCYNNYRKKDREPSKERGKNNETILCIH